jgi:hypothetical protein
MPDGSSARASGPSAELVEASGRAVALSVVVSCRLLRFPEDLNGAPTVEMSVLSRTSLAPAAFRPRERINTIDALCEPLHFVSGRTHRSPSTKRATVMRNESTTNRQLFGGRRGHPSPKSPKRRSARGAAAWHRSCPTRARSSSATGEPSGARRVGGALEEPEGSYEPKSRAFAIWPAGRRQETHGPPTHLSRRRLVYPDRHTRRASETAYR